MSLFILPAESQGAGAQPWMAGGAGTDDKHVLGGGKGLILPYTLLPQHLGTAGIAYAKQKKKPKRITGTSEQPVAAHTGSSQWTDAAEHPHKPGASLNQRRSSTVVNVYIHTHECFISASLL